MELRNAPTQARSRKTLDDIMSAADELFLAKGVDGATNTEIAEKAGVSIGSLYRFFPDKEGLVSEYVDRYMLALVEEMDAPIPPNPNMSQLADIVDLLLDQGAKVRRQFVGFSQVRTWRNAAGERPARSVADASRAVIASVFEASIYDIDEKQIKLMSQVMQISSYPVLELLPEVSKAEGDRLLDELKGMLSAYVRSKIDITKLK